jgi:actin-related protein
MSYYIIDNGSYSIKEGFSTDKACSIHPNSSSKPKYEKRTYLGSSLADCRNLSGLVQSRPFERYDSSLTEKWLSYKLGTTKGYFRYDSARQRINKPKCADH